MEKKDLTHFNTQGRAHMVDISEKADTERIAIAQGEVIMQRETLRLIKEERIKKGDVLAVAQIGGVMAAKQTGQLIPMCHNLLLTRVDLDFQLKEEDGRIIITSQVKSIGKTGVEMEALTAVAVAALTIYDMCKAVDRGITIEKIHLVEKRGGKSGIYRRAE